MLVMRPVPRVSPSEVSTEGDKVAVASGVAMDDEHRAIARPLPA